MTALVADIGGTNTRVALAEGAGLVPDSVARFRNAEHADFEAVLAAYLAASGSPEIDAACAALAGPVRDGRGRLTNLDWEIREDRIAGVTGARRVRLLNDLQAQGHALDHVTPEALVPVLAGGQVAGAPRLVIGIGTGFNAAAVHAIPGGTLVTAAEAGQVGLPVADGTDLSLAGFLADPDGFTPVEEALSGRGLERIFAWSAREAGQPRHMTARGVLTAADDDPEAQAALARFVCLMGTVAGDLALHHLPFGGIYLIGGLARAVTPHLQGPDFGARFRAKGRFRPLMEEFAVWTLVDDFAALTGCAACLAEDL